MTTDTPQAKVPIRSTRRIVLISAAQVLCVAAVGVTLYRNRTELWGAISVGVPTLLTLFLLMFVAHLQRTIEFTYMLRKLGVKEPLAEGFWLTGASFLLNHLPLNAGLVMRALVLRRDHDLSYSAYISLTLVNIVVNVAVSALVALAWLFGSAAVSNTVAAALLTAVLCGSALVFFLPSLPLPRHPGFSFRQLRNLAQGIAMIRGDGRAVLILAAIAASKIVLNAIRMTICFGALGQRLGLEEAGLLAAVQTLTVVLSITPGNLGLREMLVSLVATGFGAAHWVGLAAASIDRLVNMAYTVASGLPGLHMLRLRRSSAQRVADVAAGRGRSAPAPEGRLK
jgi:uncharacterized membrane protein YbhN (UPF0104 family)